MADSSADCGLAPSSHIRARRSFSSSSFLRPSIGYRVIVRTAIAVRVMVLYSMGGRVSPSIQRPSGYCARRDDLDLDEELALWEERDLLLARLLECKTFKDAAEVLHRLPTTPASPSRARPGPTSAFPRSCPICSRASRRERLRGASCGRRPEAGAARRPLPRHPDPGQRGRRASPSCSTSCPASAGSRSAG